MVARRALALAAGLVPALTACDRMTRQPKLRPLSPSPFFEDGRSARPRVPDTVALGGLELDAHLYAGKENGKDAVDFPFPVTRTLLRRGRERFDIACAPCHGRLGDGEGMVVRRGFPRPPSFHEERLRRAPVGHFFDVMTNGFGPMYPAAERVSARDRWAIAAYIRALQLSQSVDAADLQKADREALEKSR